MAMPLTVARNPNAETVPLAGVSPMGLWRGYLTFIDDIGAAIYGGLQIRHAGQDKGIGR